MVIPAGNFNRRIGLHPSEGAEDGMGTVATGFDADPQFETKAKVTFGSSADRRASAEARVSEGIVPSQTATFRMRRTTQTKLVDQSWAISFRDAMWGISSIAEVGSQGRELEMTATRIGE